MNLKDDSEYKRVGSDKKVHLPNRLGYFLKFVRQNPSELMRLFRIGLNTYYFRFIKRCTGKGTVIGVSPRFVNTANITIGQGCLLQDSIYIRAGVDGSIRIGDRAALNSFCKLFGHGSIDIGAETQLGPGTLITTTGHDYQDKELNATYQPVRLGRRVWVGANVTILQGVTIGDHSVIGAGAVVNKDIPPYCIAVGVPAKVVKSLKSY